MAGALVRGAHDIDGEVAAPIHAVRLLNAFESGGLAAVAEMYGMRRTERTIANYLARARAGRLQEPARKPLPQRHYRPDWAAHGIAA